MIRGGHDEMVKGFPSGKRSVGFSNRPAKRVLITCAPNICERDFRLRHGCSIDDFITVMAKKIVHIVEVAEATVDECRVVSPTLEHGAQSE